MEPLASIPLSAGVRNSDGPAAPRELGVVPGLVWAFRIHDDGTADSLPVDQPVEARHDGWLWLHVDLADARVRPWLRGTELPGAAVATMLSRDEHQQVHAAPACIHGIFADLVRRIDGTSHDIGRLHFIMIERLLISGRRHALCAVESVRNAIEGGEHRLPHVAALLELIVEHVAEGMDRAADELETELDAIENYLARNSSDFDRHKLSSIRRTSVRLHRQLSGLRAVFHRIERDGTDSLRPPLRVAAGKLAQRLDALDREILELRERGRRLQEEAGIVLTQETNRQLHVLSILTALFLPATLVTGVFGMNVKGLPFTDVETGFLSAMTFVLGASLAVYLLLRRIGIFRR